MSLKYRALTLFRRPAPTVDLARRADEARRRGHSSFKPPKANNFGRRVREPPVDQIEMVAAFVDAQPAGLRAVTVPAVEVTRPVPRIEVVGKLDVHDPSQSTSRIHALESLVGRRYTGSVRHANSAAAPLLG